MRIAAVLALGLIASSLDTSAEELRFFQRYYDEQSVETRTFSIQLAPVDESVRFSVTLRDKETSRERRYEFDAPVPEIPEPFLFDYSRHCDTSVLLLTVQYPWRHDWPQYVRTLETYAFDAADFGFIDVASGPLTDIALADDTAYEPSEIDMLSPIRVRCLAGGSGKPFEFVEEETK